MENEERYNVDGIVPNLLDEIHADALKLTALAHNVMQCKDGTRLIFETVVKLASGIKTRADMVSANILRRMKSQKTTIEFEELELEHCPYCGLVPEIFVHREAYVHPFWIGCPNSGKPFSDCHWRSGATLREAVDTWNEDCRKTRREEEELARLHLPKEGEE